MILNYRHVGKLSIGLKTGKICIAMMCAFFAGSIASTVLAGDPGFAKGYAEASPDGDGMTLDQYELLFGLDLTNPDNAFLDYDQDGLLNWEEAYKGTDPFRADTDEDGWPDAVDNEISRARFDFHPLFTDGNSFRYAWPSWMVAAFKAGGEWDPSLPAWYVPAGTGGKLCLIVDRSLLTGDVVLELEFYDAPNASLFVDLVNRNNETLISSELLGNLVDGSGDIVRKAINIPLEIYPEAVGIHIRGTGELFLFEGLIFVDRDNDGLDADQEAILGTSDLILDSDGDGIADYQEVFVYGTNPANRGTSPVSGGDKGRDASPRHPSSDGSESRPFSGASPRAFHATRTKSITIPQYVLARLAGAQSWMGGANFMMSRDVLDGGGTRQTSTAFIMEDSFAQSSPIGFSYGSDITLHAGYQQAEAEQIEFWNVSVTPPPYLAQQRRFNPGLAETSTFSYVLSTPGRAVSVAVYNQAGALVRTLLNQQPQDEALHTVAWDGRNDAGDFVPENQRYTFRLSALTYDGVATNYQPANINEVRMRVVNNIPVIQSVNDQPDPFFPDLTNATISYVTAAPISIRRLDMAIEIFADNLSGPMVQGWTFNNQPVGPHSVVWDGTDRWGRDTPDGLYAYSIRDRDVARRANTKTGAILLIRTNTQATASADGRVEMRYAGPATVSIEPAGPEEASEALFAIQTADPGQVLQSVIYRIEATPPTTFDPPALMAFKYDAAISGDIEQKLQIRRYNETNQVWEPVPIQFIDYANHQIFAEVSSLSLYALLTGEDTTPPVIEIVSPQARTYPSTATIPVLYKAEDPVVGGISSGVADVFVYLNGELYPYATIPPSAFMPDENVLTVAAYDGAGNIGQATVIFTVVRRR